jgi:muramoyltetrapeptide carboxypeptidase
MAPEKLASGIKYLQSLGYEVKLARHVNERHGYLAGNDAQRAADLNEMFQDDSVKAVFCARGGYGTPRILNRIDFSAIRRNPKIFVGYSDVTALQLAMLSHSGLISFSGPMVAVEMGAGITEFTAKHFWRLLTTPNQRVLMQSPADEFSCIRPGLAEGLLIGGCLSLVTSLIGTAYLPDLTGSILFLEDIGEEPYQVDRHLMQLKLCGALDRVSGIVFCRFEECQPSSSQSLTLDEVLREASDGLNIPVMSNWRYGHSADKFTLPVGIRAQFDAEAGYLELLEPAIIGSSDGRT